MPDPWDNSNKPLGEVIKALFEQGLSLHQQGMLEQALEAYQKVLTLQPAHFGSLHFLGVIAAQTKKPERAVELITRAIEVNPNIAATYGNRGIALQDLKRHEEALQSFDRAIALKSDYAATHYHRGNTLLILKRFEEALQSYDKAIALRHDHAEVHNNRGVALKELKRHEDALQSYDTAIAFRPDNADAYYNRGNALLELQRYDEALRCYDKTIALKADHSDAHYNRGNALQELQRYDEALRCYDMAIALRPDHAWSHNNRGNALQELQRYDEALRCYDMAITLRPDYADAFFNRGNALRALKQYSAALRSYEGATALKPDDEYLHGIRLHTKMNIGDWGDIDTDLLRLERAIDHGEKAVEPFPVLALKCSAPLQRRAAEIWVKSKYPAHSELPKFFKRSGDEKIRIGYYSADYHDHATAYLMVGLFEQHDKDRFESVAFSFGPNKNNKMRKRVSAAFDKFVDVRDQSVRDVAMLSRKLEIDIAVDLKGFTTDNRVGIFAYRAAPIQVNYLGYPGTMGAEYIDYLIADGTLIPKESRQHYSEKIAYLPNSYQANDTKRRISEKNFTRKELGLPASGFVFCCFNNNYKITPNTFDGWMRILRHVNGSVLWLLENNPTAVANLRKEAVRRGVVAERLIFAERMPLADHLARHRAADLFIDTLPYNAHTTASDALWAGLPVLTCMAESFASRVAASLLNAIRLPELITITQQEYEALAIELATNPVRLKQIRQKLERSRLTVPLFNTELFTKHIEDAYTRMYERYRAGLLPEHFHVGQ